MAKRTTRFYRKNEEEVMEALGLQATKNSGAGWVEKEDGQNDHLIAQLKSTDAKSINIKLRDIQVLEANALVCHKVPMFVVQFLETGDTFIMARPRDMEQVVEYINTGVCEKPTEGFDLSQGKKPKVNKIRSSEDSRKAYWENKRKEAEEKYGTPRRSKSYR